MDDAEIIAHARAKAQQAMSAARMATDPETERSWQQLADAWLTLLWVLEERPTKPVGPRPSRRPPA